MNYKYKIPCSKTNLKDIRDFVSQVLNNHQVDGEEITRLVLAVDEVCSNLIIHSNNENVCEFLEIFIVVKKNNGVTFEIKDKGIGFDISKYIEPALSDIVKTRRKGGLGLMLVNRIMDQVEWHSEADSNTCRLYKKLDAVS